MSKLISIVIATYNASATLEQCLASIVGQLTDECELIIIDGGSSDSTNDIISKFKEKVAYTISEKDKGIYDAWNKGIAQAQGDWVAFIGADDMLLPNTIATYLKLIKSTEGIDTYDYICAHVEYVDMNGKLLKVLGEEPKWNSMRKRMAPAHVASLHNKKNLFDTVGVYDFESYHICADYELLMRKKNHLKYIMIPEHIARMKAGGMSFSIRAIKETYQIRKSHHSISGFTNYLLYLSDILFYRFFVFRKTLGGASLAKLIGKIKGGAIDERIPSGYLFRLVISKAVSLLYGMFRLRTLRRVYVHPSSVIKCPSKMSFGRNLNIERGCYIDALSVEGLQMGENVSFGYNTCLRVTGTLGNIGNGIIIGNNVGLGSHGFYGCGMGHLEIGDDTIFGNYVSIHPENHNYSDLSTPIRLQGVSSSGVVKIGKGCWIGAKATILDGTSIGDGCIVAAGAVVKGEFPNNTIIGGVPAKILKYRT